MKEREEKDKSGLTIRLAESVTYLKDVDFSGRCRTHNELSPPSMVRGILVLHLSKPTKICSVGIELTARSSTRWPDGAGAGRVEVIEDHQLYSSSTVYFRQEAGGHQSRRAVSLGPRTTAEDDSSSDPDIDHEDIGSPHARRRTRDPVRSRRGVSVDLQNFHRDVVSHHVTSRIPTPAYIPSAENTPEESPAISEAHLSVAQPPSLFDQGSSTRSLSRAQSNPPPDQRDHVPTSGQSCASVPSPPASRTRTNQALEDFRRALRPDLNAPPTRPPPFRIDTNALASPILNTSLHSPPNETPIRFSPTRSPSEPNEDARDRASKSRFSLSAISDAILDSVRSRSPLAPKRRAEDAFTRGDTHDGERNTETVRGRSREKAKRELSHALIKVSEVLGLEPEEGRESRDGWKEFKRGTYRYPISFAIPADSPPSLDCMYGSIVWTLKATVHRPGKFTPRMEVVRNVNVVATPSEDATDDIESVTVNKTWEDQMEYYLSVVGRAFPIGSKVPIQLTFLPLAKVKIHKVSVVIDEKITYYAEMQKVAKAPKASRQVLFSLKYSSKNTPILPLREEDPRKSPLYSLVREDLEYTGQGEEERASQLATEWMGPGPWPLRFNVEIPNTYGGLRPTNMNKKGNITVCHVLKIIIRVEKGNAYEGDGDGLKKKMYDIIIQYPVHLLSYLCNQKYTLLPPYSATWHSVPTKPGQPASSEPGSSSVVHEVSAIEVEPPTPDHSASTDHSTRTASRERERLTLRFERLVAGQEAETGESPPSYNAATSPAHPDNIHVLRI